jgi:L-serine dehydratase
MNTSVFDIYTIGIGPSSSHTVGPMRAARRFVTVLEAQGLLARTVKLSAELFGSLGATGKGHHSDRAVLMGLEGESPEEIDVERIIPRCQAITDSGRISLLGRHEIAFDVRVDLVFHRMERLPLHSNGMVFRAFDRDGLLLKDGTYYSVGGGFVAESDGNGALVLRQDGKPFPLPFNNCAELLERCTATGLTIAQLVRENEKSRRGDAEISAGLQRIWTAMQACIQKGIATGGELPGALHVKRRAPLVHQSLISRMEDSIRDPAAVLDWLNACTRSR